MLLSGAAAANSKNVFHIVRKQALTQDSLAYHARCAKENYFHCEARPSLAGYCAYSTTLSVRMADDHNSGLSIWPDLIEKIRARTPARVLADRIGAAYRTATQLQLRHDHAAAREAVRAELDLERDLGAEFVRHWNL